MPTQHPDTPLVLLLRISRKWREDLTADELYEVTRGWWVMSGQRTEQIVTVLAVVNGQVREAYEPRRWIMPSETGRENRWGFEGTLASDREHWLGRDVSKLFPAGAANPVRYVEAASLQPDASVSATLAERVLPLLAGFEDDLLFAMPRSAQELFHTNTLAWLIDHEPVAAEAILSVFGTPTQEAFPPRTWREHHHLDLLVDPGADELRLVVENKLFSVPSRQQLVGYTTTSLPWSTSHGPEGAARTRYILFSLMKPAFAPPSPWVHVSYEEMAEALADSVDGIKGANAELVTRYSHLLTRLAGISEVVDPRFDQDEPFFDLGDAEAVLKGSALNGPIQKLRFTGLAELVKAEVGEKVDLEVGMSMGMAQVSFYRSISATRTIGWQLQGRQLRLCVLLDDTELYGRGDERAAARAQLAQAEYPHWFDFSGAEKVLGDKAQLLQVG